MSRHLPTLRTHPLKPMAVIIDVTDNWFQHGLPDERRQWSLQPKVPGSLQTVRLIQCSACTHVFQPQPQELEIITGEVGEDGLLIQHHQASCPSCRHIVLFTTKETISSKTTSISPIRLKHSLREIQKIKSPALLPRITFCAL